MQQYAIVYLIWTTTGVGGGGVDNEGISKRPVSGLALMVHDEYLMLMLDRLQTSMQIMYYYYIYYFFFGTTNRTQNHKMRKRNTHTHYYNKRIPILYSVLYFEVI